MFNLFVKIITFLFVTGPTPRYDGKYIKPEVLDHYRDECGEWHTHVRANHSSHVAAMYRGHTLAGDKSWRIRKVGRNAYEVTTETWDTRKIVERKP